MDALSIVSRLGNGRLIGDLAEALCEVAERVVETGKPGQVTVTLKLSNSEAGDVMVVIADQVARRLPTKAARGTFLYAVEGGLYARDPRQTRMEFRPVEAAPAEVRETVGGAPTIREA